MSEISANLKNILGSLTPLPRATRVAGQVGGVAVRNTHGFCTLSPLSLPYPLASLSPSLRRRGFQGHFALLVVSKHGFSTERARLAGGTSYVHTASAQNVQDQAGGTSLRSWFQKKCLLPVGILIFFFQKILDFENSSWIFFH